MIHFLSSHRTVSFFHSVFCFYDDAQRIRNEFVGVICEYVRDRYFLSDPL